MSARRGSAKGVLCEVARGVAGGAVGTGAMSLAARVRRDGYARRNGITVAEIEEILDYDDSEHVVIAASTLLHRVIGWAPRSEQGRTALFWLVHWGYGSAVGAGHVGLQKLLGREPAPALAFFVGCQAMALSLFPILGETPPPWRWERRLLVTSMVQHAIYAGGVAAANTVTARAVTARKVTARKVTARKVTARKVTARKVTARKVTAGTVAAGTVTGGVAAGRRRG